MKHVGSDANLATIVVGGGGKAVSAGVDVGNHVADKVADMLDLFHGIFRKLASTDALTIAAVNGAALGGGCELACFCDIVLASEKAKFGQPEVQVGVFPPVAASILPLQIGLRKAIELNALGQTINAGEALRIGLASHVYPVDVFDYFLFLFWCELFTVVRQRLAFPGRCVAGSVQQYSVRDS